ncbi:MAG TPA: hypothetical protein DEP00_02640 [Lachnospiraceae bacterium]|nr:hypothetical protein [Lachnospiraceae bacterium]
MTIKEILKRVAEYHPDLGPDYQGCDGIKVGDPDKECTGIVSSLVPTVEVIRKCAAAGANLLFIHEPTSYLSPDWPQWKADYDCSVYDEKIKLANNLGIVIVRDHDHMHAHRPDSIFTGVLKYLGWEPYLVIDEPIPMGFTVNFPQPRTLEELNHELISTIGMNGLRYIGDSKAAFTKVSIAGHLFPGAFIPPTNNADGTYTDYATEIIRQMEAGKVECIIPGEIVEWTVLSYVRDAIALGRNMAVINPGHFNWEELGARYAADWLKDLTEGKVPITYVPTGDLWSYKLKDQI